MEQDTTRCLLLRTINLRNYKRLHVKGPASERECGDLARDGRR